MTEAAESAVNKMNPEVKARWVAALRSGEYEQGHAVLRGREGFCCLGVLCEIYANDTGTRWLSTSWDGMRLDLPDGSAYYPPPKVREWADFHEDRSPIDIGGVVASVAVHNDGESIPKRTFAEIADAIEAQL